MLFNSFTFIGLLLVTLLLYYLPCFKRYQIQILILASLVFYSYNRPILVLLLLFSVSINIVSSYWVVYGKPERRFLVATLGVALNLSLLLFFKYSPMFSRLFFPSSSSIGEFLLTVPLPIGISFFTFQGISLVVDVFKENYFKGKDVVPPSFAEHAKRVLFFKAFFPQLISGPIVKAHDFFPQIKFKRFSDIQWETCFRSLVAGYFLKMVVADNLKDYTFWIQYPYFGIKSTLTLLMLLFGYSCQIFADFSGYSLIAIGLAKLFGYHFNANFNYPYISSSFREFWKRWHISLSTFLMEYLYIPLGGNRKGSVRTYINLLTTMVLGGLWHGAAVSYAVWGLFHGGALAVERFFDQNFNIPGGKIVMAIRWFIVFAFVTLAWLLFKLPNFSQVILYLKAIYSNLGGTDVTLICYLVLYSLPIAAYHIYHLLKRETKYDFLCRVDSIVFGVMLFLVATNSGSPGAFIYFQF